MTYTLRPYQNDAVAVALDCFKHYGKPFVVQMATGAGKSLVIAELCHQLDQPVLILQPSKELLEQNYAKLQSYGINDIAIYSASKNTKEIGKFTYATIGSIYKKPELFKHFKYIIIDECDLVDPKNFDGMYRSFLNALDTQRICGLTATPYRLVQKFVTYNGQTSYTASLRMINRIAPFLWKNIVYAIETQDLIDQGYLCPIQYHTDDVQLDMLKVNSTGADFTVESLEGWAKSKVERITAAVLAVDPKCHRNLVFCSSITQCEAVQRALEAQNVPAYTITAKTPPAARESAVEAFRRGEVKHLLNVGVFLAGFDLPELDSIIMARPTMSLRLWYQAVGRGVRLDPARPDKLLHVIDLAGVTDRMGRVEFIRLGKEAPPNQWKDCVRGEFGRMDETALFTFKIKPKKQKQLFGEQ